MNTYPQRVRDNILPLSVADTLPKAFEEWSFTEHTEDHGKPLEICQLCDQEDIRYHFDIRNSLTRHMLQVGSHCILKFGVSVFEGDQKLSESDARKKLNRLMQQMRLESCVQALEQLSKTENNDILKNALVYYRKNKYLPLSSRLLFFGGCSTIGSTIVLRSSKSICREISSNGIWRR